MIRNLAYASLSAASAGLLVVLFILAGRALGDVEFGSSLSPSRSARFSRR